MDSSDLADALQEVHSQIRRCRRCPLGRTRTKAVPGEGAPEASLMFVGEAPGGDEDQQGRPFVGPAGRLLTHLLKTIGLDRRQVFITNVVKCRPPGNRDPSPEEIAACNEYLLTQIALITPKVLCTLGRFAGQTLIDKRLSISREHGKPRRVSGILYLPLYHPAAALHQARLIDSLEADMRQLRRVLAEELATPPSKVGPQDA
ncbi:MAG: uracil-DNA glycosylase [Armatimonadota bacterium]|nr:MAG: uracil-DNA glycosylase [Armatimonadota bacterium]